MNATRPEILSRFAEKIPFLDALYPDYGKRVLTYEEATYPTARNVPVFHAATTWREDATREERVVQLVNDIRALTPTKRPAFLHAFLLNWFSDLPMLGEVMDRLGPEYAAVRPDHLAALCRQAWERDQVLDRFPSPVAAIEGQATVIHGAVRNVSDAEQQVEIRLTGGLDQGQLDPDTVKLAPAQEAAVTLHGQPTGDRIELALQGAFGTRPVSIALLRVARAELAEPLPPFGLLSPAKYLEAEALSHRFGEAAADPTASEGTAWVGRKGKTEPGHLLFGPYAPLEAGRHLALFRLKRLDEGTGVLAHLDTCVGGGVPQTAERELRAEELPLNEWRWVALALDHPGGAFETRLEWSGAASLATDAVALWRVEGEAR
ncbi:MAG: hypothetical protein AUJ96_20325 [Armatimonadetes bacterium CG2_30_66_41]|nr:hypothetical protein [Armatimonadota bacterium]OIO98914.1 MAG: hypothetical protein AUJ96_20325 [Armatimonadetes bacterium CG2_30_66_41]NCO93265.1 hypothetical protein [Armatimonadota bacterium]NCP34127.1 hypothetical protein [Armatimonadota bacterium]NCQ30646.1 hypothetical protein [Armatimonadota bacterium]